MTDRGLVCWLPGLVSQSVLLWDVVGLEMVTGLKGHVELRLLRHTNSAG